MDDYLSKPVTLASLGTLLADITDSRATASPPAGSDLGQPLVAAGTAG